MPAAHRAHIKRPDFIVAVDGLSIVAVDAKAKSLSDGCFVLDASEHRRLDGFEAVFGIPVWYACFPPEEEGRCYLFRNRDLIGPTIHFLGLGNQTISAPVTLGHPVRHLSTMFSCALQSHRVA
jgi:hypothetical protein